MYDSIYCIWKLNSGTQTTHVILWFQFMLCVCVFLTGHKRNSVQAYNEMNLLHEDSLRSECGPSDLLACSQEENLSHYNTQEPSRRSKK